MSAALRLSSTARSGPLHLAVVAGLACAFLIGKALPATMDAVSAVIEPLCASSAQSAAAQDVVEPITSHAGCCPKNPWHDEKISGGDHDLDTTRG